MAGRSLPRVAFVTSGLGHAFGGIGVVAEMAVAQLQGSAALEIWRHHHRWPAAARAAALAAAASWGALRPPQLVFYEHVDLARMHEVIPHLRRVPYVLLLVGTEVWYPLDGRRRRAVEQATLRLAISETTLQLARQHNPWLPPATVTWLGVRPAAPGQSSPERRPRALIVGRMDPSERRKGHDPILDAWPLIREAVKDAELFIVGEGDDRPRLEARVRSEALAGVTFTGKLSDTARNELYRTSRLFLFPSLQEGFGLAAVEAAAAGMPVLGVSGTVMEELFTRDDGVVFVPEPSGRRIAEAAIPVLRDEGLATSLGAQAQRRACAQFLEAHFGERLRTSLAPLLTKRPS